MTDDVPEQEEGDLEEQVEKRLGTSIEGVGTLDEIVGIGGMATVYRANPGDGGDPVAVKLMHQHLADKGSLRERFMREAKILGQADDHPNAISVFGRGRLDSGEAYFVMELLDGWEVETVWKQKDGEFPVPEALEIGMQALGALHAYHEAEVLHRDLKPSNLFLTREGVVKLIDFGVARFRDDDTQKTRAGTALGTPAYMAPEQAMGKVDILDARTDVYGLGAVLFTMMSGRRVHEADSNDETLVQAATQPADSLARHAPDVPTEAVQLVDKALNWDPDDRFESAEHMQREIEALLDDDSITLERQEKVSEEEVERAEEVAAQELGEVDAEEIEQQIIENVKLFFERLDRLLNEARSYGWDHDKVYYVVDNTLEAVEEALEFDPEGLYWRVRPHSFETEDEVVWEPEDPFHMIPYNLFSDGFRRMSINEDLTRDELEEFAKWIRMNPDVDLPTEDDMATYMWDLGLEGVDTQMVTTFDIEDTEDDDIAFEDEVEQVLEDAEDFFEGDSDGRELLMAMQSGAYAEAEALAGEAGADQMGGSLAVDYTTRDKGLMNPKRVDQMSETIGKKDENWDDRYGKIYSEVWADVVGDEEAEPMIESSSALIDYYLQEDRVETILEILLRIHDNLDTEVERNYFARETFDGANIKSLLEAVILDPSYEEEERERLLKYLSKLMGILPEIHFNNVLQLYVESDEKSRQILMKYLKRHVEGHEDEVADIFPKLEVDELPPLVRLLSELSTPNAFDALKQLLFHPDEDVRERVLEIVTDRFDLARVEMGDELQNLLNDENPGLRISALKLAAEAAYDRFVPELVDRATDSEFNERPVAERTAILDALKRLNRKKAEKVAIELTEHHGVLPDSSRNTSRMLAIRMLADIASSERAVEAVESATSAWWWNSEQVRECAEAALDDINQKVGA